MQTSRIAIAMAVAALALGGCGKKDDSSAVGGSNVAAGDLNAAQSPDAGASNAATATLSPAQAFANSAAASDAFEIQSSQMALTSAKSPAVKKFAQQMIDAHTQSTAKLKSIAAGLAPAITPDPALSPDQQTALDGLKGKTGAEFDTTYVAAQQDAHQKTLDALRGYSTSGDQPALQAFATEMTPKVAAHLNMAKSLKP